MRATPNMYLNYEILCLSVSSPHKLSIICNYDTENPAWVYETEASRNLKTNCNIQKHSCNLQKKIQLKIGGALNILLDLF